MLPDFNACVDELQKIADVSAQLQLKATPWELGILSKKTGDNDRALAAMDKVPRRALSGATGGAIAAAALGTPVYEALNAEGRKAIKKGLVDDVEAVRGGLRSARRRYIRDVAKKLNVPARDAAYNPALLNRLTEAERKRIYQRSLEAGLKKLEAPLLRRLKGSGKAALIMGGTAGGLKMLSNLSQYEGARSLAGRGDLVLKPSKSNPKVKRWQQA